MAAEPPHLTIPELDPRFDDQEVTLTFSVAGTQGVAQRGIPGKPLAFIIEPRSEDDVKTLTVWVSGDLADVMERLQMGLFSPNLKKGTRIQATGTIRYSPPTDNDQGNKKRFYEFRIDDWKKFRILTGQETAAGK